MWRDPAFVLAALTVVLSPMNYLRLSSIYITASDIAAVLALVILAARGSFPHRLFGPGGLLWLGGFLALCGGLLLGSVAHGSPEALASVLAQYAFSLLLLQAVLAVWPAERMIVLLRCFVLAILFVMLFGIWMVHFAEDPPPVFVGRSGRMQSLVERENECAALGAMAAVVLLGLWRAGKVRLIELLPTLAVIVYGISLTGSNTGVGCLILGAGTLTVLSGSGRMAAVIGIVAASLVAVTLTLPDAVPPVFRGRVLSAFETGNLSDAGTFDDRVILIREAFSMAREHLIVGMGADQYRASASEHQPVHNTYLLLLNEGGLLSLVGLVSLMLAGLPGAVAHLARRETRAAGAVTLSILLIYAAMLNTFPHFYARFWNVPLILVFGLTAGPLPGRRARDGPGTPSAAQPPSAATA